MKSALEQLKQFTTLVADTGDIEAIRCFTPEDATTNPSLIYKAAQLPQYETLLHNAVAYAKQHAADNSRVLELTLDKLSVDIGTEILNIIPGRISTEVDARLSFDTQGTVKKAHELIRLYKENGVNKARVLIKIAATWQGIKAAEVLEKEGIQCNLTLLFSFAQARACAEAGVFLISPFVGRIYDWYQAHGVPAEYDVARDQGVASVRTIFSYYKHYGYNTIVMGASFRRTEQILALTGCDRLTISPPLLTELSNSHEPVSLLLNARATGEPAPDAMTEQEFLWQHNQDAMAVEKLAEGIRLFTADLARLEQFLTPYL